ncbi:F-box protein [Phanerochaete sordida]|uniref:F-box protein n=1 Tax=Phanerochaete sordida TaxID=48140 RepID=A0A9P3GRK4_9APHY|nr:F-box protein [Phanerochaete sordida]
MTSSLPPPALNLVLENLSNEPTSLKNCSLVSPEWSTVSASLLFKSLRWPPRKQVPGLLEDLSSLLECLMSSSRVRSSVCELRIYSSKRDDSSSITAVMPQILAFLPKLRSLYLDTLLATPAEFPADPRVEAQDQRRTIDSVHLACKLHDLPVLLSPFRHIASLIVTCHGGTGPQEIPAPRPPDPTLSVDSITLHSSDEAVLSVLQGVLDTTRVHSLTLSAAPTLAQPALQSVLGSMSALRSLAYARVDPAAPPFAPGAAPRLHAVALGGHLLARAAEPARTAGVDDPGGRSGDADRAPAVPAGLGYSEWAAVLRDLRLLVCAATAHVALTLTVDEAHTVRDAESAAGALRAAFGALDWRGLGAVLRGAAALTSVRLGVVYGGFLDAERCAGVLREVARERLPAGVVEKLRVEVV